MLPGVDFAGGLGCFTCQSVMFARHVRLYGAGRCVADADGKCVFKPSNKCAVVRDRRQYRESTYSPQIIESIFFNNSAEVEYRVNMIMHPCGHVKPTAQNALLKHIHVIITAFLPSPPRFIFLPRIIHHLPLQLIHNAAPLHLFVPWRRI
jgi:hypothetical protein